MKSTALIIISLFLFGQLCHGQKTNEKTKMEQSERYKRGWKKLKEIDGEAGEKVINGLKDISPDLGKFIIEYSFGDIYTRDGLDLKSKEIAVVAASTALGTAQPQLKVHINRSEEHTSELQSQSNLVCRLLLE